MPERKILVEGSPDLREQSRLVTWPDPGLEEEIADLHDTLSAFQKSHGYGRAIAAPQVGIPKRLIAMNLGAGQLTLINPEVVAASAETFEVWDDCMSVPDRVVKVSRHRSISLRYTDELGRERIWRRATGPLSELLQHELDHLDGVLMLDRAMPGDSVRPVSERDRLVEASRSGHRLSLQAIAEATTVIDPVFLQTPQYECEPLSEELGCRLILKVETVNPIRSFKGRGAEYFFNRAEQRGDDRPLVCASAGNFGQAMAYTARKYRRHLAIYASEAANPLKIERMRRLGAEVRLHGEDFDVAKAEARCHADPSGSWLIEDGREPEISEGAGTIAVELLAGNQLYEAITVPLGNGALLTGMARWFKASSPATEVIGVSSTGADAMEKSWRSGRIVQRDDVDTIADGIAVRIPVPEAVRDMQEIVDDVFLVEDHHIVEAMRLLHHHAGLVTEPAGAAGLASILADPDRFSGRRVATIVAGGNLSREDVRTYLTG